MTEAPSPDRRTERRVLLGLLLLAFLLKVPALGLPMWNRDDWGGLEAGHRLLIGGWHALRPMLTGEHGPRADRPVPALWWALGLKLFGGWTGGFYAMSLAVHLVGGAALFALLRRLLRSTLGAAVGCSVYLFNHRTGQGAEFLGAIDGDLATSLLLVCLAMWGRARRSWRWSAAVGLTALVACSAKTTAIALPGVLLLLDAIETDREAWRPAALARRWIPVALALAIASVRVIGSVGRMNADAGRGGPRGGDGGIDAILVPFFESALLPTWSWYRDPEWNLADPLRWLLLLGVAGLAVRARSVRWRPLLGGLGASALLLVIPYLFLVSRGMGVIEGRHMLMPSIGVSIAAGAVAASRPLDDRIGRGLSVGFVALSALLYLVAGTPALTHHERTASPALIDALSELEPGGPVHVGLATLDPGTLAALDGEVLSSLVGGLDRRPGVHALGAGLEVRGQRVESFDPSRATGERWLVEEVRRSGRTTRTRFVAVDPSSLPPRAAGLPWAWDLNRPGHSWSVDYPWGTEEDDLEDEEDEDDRLVSSLLPPTWWVEPPGRRALVRRSRRHAMTSAAMALSPPLEIDAAGICEIRVHRQLQPGGRMPPPQELEGRLRGGCHGLVAWSTEADFSGEQIGIGWMTGCDGRDGGDVLRARLDQVPSWRSAGTVRRLAVLPADQAGRATLHRVELIPCER